MVRHDRWTVSALIIAGAASWSTGGRTAPAVEPVKPATLEGIPGSDLKRVVLTKKAAERLGIRTEGVREEPVTRWMMVVGEVEAMTMEQTLPTVAGPAGVGAAAADAAPVLVRVPLLDDQDRVNGHATLLLSLGNVASGDEEDDNRNDGEEGRRQDPVTGTPKNVFVLPTGDNQGSIPLRARPIQVAHEEGAKAQYYEVNAAGHALKPGQRVNIKVPQPGSGTPQKVIPYSAVIYDAHGDTWVYTNPEPLVFVRQPVNVAYIKGDLAVLKEGPAVGATGATVGAVEMLGIENSFGH
jgi:hypothetical protein